MEGSVVRLRMPKRASYAIEDLKQAWSVTSAAIKQWMLDGELCAHASVPLISAYRIHEMNEEGAVRPTKKLCHFEGYVPLSRYHCQRIFRQGFLALREFSSICGENRYVLPEAANDFIVSSEELIILSDERKRFEAKYRKPIEAPSNLQAALNEDAPPSPCFKSITVDGEVHYFGAMQQTIFQLLHDAALQGEPWQNGKRLLQEANSESFTLSNIFKHKPIWRRIIESDRRGAYRLKPEFIRRDSSD